MWLKQRQMAAGDSTKPASAALREFDARLRHAVEGPDEGKNIPNVAVLAADKDGK